METIYCENRNGATQETLFQDRVRPKVPSHDTRSLGLGRSPPGLFIIIIGSGLLLFQYRKCHFLHAATEKARPTSPRPRPLAALGRCAYETPVRGKTQFIIARAGISYISTPVYCPLPFIGHELDTKEGEFKKCLILLARPRGFEPLLPP